MKLGLVLLVVCVGLSVGYAWQAHNRTIEAERELAAVRSELRRAWANEPDLQALVAEERARQAREYRGTLPPLYGSEVVR